jgi:fucose permease
MNAIAAPRASRGRLRFAVLCAGFVVTGIVVTLVGPALPVYIARWSLNDAQAGLFFTAQFLGSLAGVILSSALMSARGFRPTLVLGFFLMAAGFSTLNAGGENIALCACIAYGCGYGFVIPATNLWVAETSGARGAALLNLLNLAWGAGALVCPLLVYHAARSGRFQQLLFAVAAASALLGLIVASAGFETSNIASNSEGKLERGFAGVRVAVVLGFLFYLYVGTENGISGWVAAHAKRVGAASGMNWSLAPVFFWTGLLAGRGIASVMLLRMREGLAAAGGLLLAAAGTCILIAARSPREIIVGAVVAGLGLSSVYPIFIAWLSNWYGVRARAVSGGLFTLAAFGGATMPWFVGQISARQGGLRAGLFVPLAGCLVMLALLTLLRGPLRHASNSKKLS